MVFEFTLTVIGASLLGWSVAYWTWARVRVTFLRQNLFRVRDELWDRAREANALDDPLHLQTRDHLNSVIEFAEVVSIDVLTHVAKNRPKFVAAASDRPDVTAMCNEAKSKAADTVMTYVLFRTASGLVFIFQQVMRSSFRSSREALESSVQWLMSPAPEELVHRSINRAC